MSFRELNFRSATIFPFFQAYKLHSSDPIWEEVVTFGYHMYEIRKEMNIAEFKITNLKQVYQLYYGSGSPSLLWLESLFYFLIYIYMHTKEVSASN